MPLTRSRVYSPHHGTAQGFVCRTLAKTQSRSYLLSLSCSCINCRSKKWIKFVDSQKDGKYLSGNPVEAV